MNSSYNEFIKRASISEEDWLELASQHGLTVEEYKDIHKEAWESFSIPKHRMFMNVALKGMIARYRKSKGAI
jgi:hypothetical protein